MDENEIKIFNEIASITFQTKFSKKSYIISIFLQASSVKWNLMRPLEHGEHLNTITTNHISQVELKTNYFSLRFTF